MESVKFVKTSDISEKIEDLFQSEKTKLLKVIPNAQIEHIGGTSVPGLISKGDLDINVRVESKDFNKATDILKILYLVNQPENWTESFSSFKDDSRDLGIQLTILNSSGDHFVSQREYLRIHPEAVSELNTLKMKFENANMQDYRKEKNKFFEKLNSLIYA